MDNNYYIIMTIENKTNKTPIKTYNKSKKSV